MTKMNMRLTITLLLAVAIVRGQSPGAFTATGSMMTPHGGHTATLLLNGKVLMAGGYRASIFDDVPLPHAELYEPSTGAFTTIDDITRDHSALAGTFRFS